jgi:hypothetical protein
VPTTPISVSVRLADGHNLVVPATVSGTNATTSLPLAVVKAGGGALAISVSAPGPSASEPVVGAVVVAAEAASAPLALHQPASGTVRFVLDGFVQGLLTPPHWVYVGHVGPLVLYRNTRVRGPAWLEAAGARSSSMPSAAGSVQSPSLPPWQDPVTIVDAPHAALLVRSEQYSPGWSATVQPVTGSGSLGPPSILPVRPIGLLQGVVIPAGRSRVTWHYHSGRAELGLGLAAAGCVACASFGLLGLRSRRRRLAPTT